MHSTPSVLHREHLTPPSHFRWRLRHGTQATATDVRACALWPFWTGGPASDFGVCAGGVTLCTLSCVVELADGDRCSASGDESERSWVQKAGSMAAEMGMLETECACEAMARAPKEVQSDALSGWGGSRGAMTCDLGGGRESRERAGPEELAGHVGRASAHASGRPNQTLAYTGCAENSRIALACARRSQPFFVAHGTTRPPGAPSWCAPGPAQLESRQGRPVACRGWWGGALA